MATSDFMYIFPDQVLEEPDLLEDWLNKGLMPEPDSLEDWLSKDIMPSGSTEDGMSGLSIESDSAFREDQAFSSPAESDTEVAPAKPVHKIISFPVFTTMDPDKKAAHDKSKYGPRPCHAHRQVSLRDSPEDIKNLRRVEAMCRRFGLRPPTFVRTRRLFRRCFHAELREDMTGYPRLTGQLGRSGYFPTSRAAKKVCVEKLLALIKDILADYGLEVSYEEYYNLPCEDVEAMDAIYRDDEPVSVINQA